MTILSLFTHSCVVQKRLLFLWRLESFSVIIIAWKKATGTVNADRIYKIILWMNLFSESGWFVAEVLNSSPRPPPLCIFSMSLFVNTPDSDNQLVRSALRAWTVFRLTCSLHRVHCSLHRVHCSLHRVHCSLHRVHCSLHRVHCSLHRVHCSLHRVHCSLHRVHCSLHRVHCSLHRVHCSLHRVHCSLHRVHCSLHRVHCFTHGRVWHHIPL